MNWVRLLFFSLLPTLSFATPIVMDKNEISCKEIIKRLVESSQQQIKLSPFDPSTRQAIMEGVDLDSAQMALLEAEDQIGFLLNTKEFSNAVANFFISRQNVASTKELKMAVADFWQEIKDQESSIEEVEKISESIATQVKSDLKKMFKPADHLMHENIPLEDILHQAHIDRDKYFAMGRFLYEQDGESTEMIKRLIVSIFWQAKVSYINKIADNLTRDQLKVLNGRFLSKYPYSLRAKTNRFIKNITPLDMLYASGGVIVVVGQILLNIYL